MTKDQLQYNQEGFAQIQFTNYMIAKHELNKDLFAVVTIENVIDYAFEHYAHSCDKAAEFISDILPYTDFEDVAAYMHDSLLTNEGKKAKELFWSRAEADAAGQYYYYFDCLDADIGDRYFTAEELKQITGAETEKGFIHEAVNYEAALFRYNRDPAGNYINETCLYDCMR